MKVKIAPSILSADRDRLQDEVSEIEPFSDFLHVDIMDGKFVPPTTFRAEEIKKLKTNLPIDVHLMVEHPLSEGYIDSYIDAGAERITIHSECKDDIAKCLQYIKQRGVKTSISVKPKTELMEIDEYLDKVDMILIMSVEPGYSGQEFMEDVLPKVKKLRDKKPELDIEIDGGLNKDTIKSAVDAGANIIVAASAIFGQRDRKKAIEVLRSAAE